MSITRKKRILTEYFRKHGGFPSFNIEIDTGTGTVGNVKVNGAWYGVFDYKKERFVKLAF